MTKLHEIKPGKIARIVAFENGPELKKRFMSKGIFEGCFVRLISSFGLITLKKNSKILSVSKNIAENVRVIELKETQEVECYE